MRVGPSRLISTAPSRGASKATVAAEWITMSHVASMARSASSRPRPSVPTSPVMTCTRRAVISAKPSLAELAAEAVEGVVLQHLALDPLRRGRPLAGPHEQDDLAAGDGAQQSLDQRGPDEAGRSGHGDALAGEGFGDHGVCLPCGKWPARDPPTVGNLRAHPGRRARSASAPGASRPRRSTPWPPSSGITKQTILYWFGSKDGVLEAVVERMADRAGRPRWRPRVARSATGYDRVEAVLTAVFRFGVRQPGAAGPAAGAEPARTRVVAGPLAAGIDAAGRAGRGVPRRRDGRRHDPSGRSAAARALRLRHGRRGPADRGRGPASRPWATEPSPVRALALRRLRRELFA